MKKPNADQLEQMQDARTAALIRKWLAGKKLTDEEKIEIHQRAGIPLDILSAGPSAPGSKEIVSRLKDTRKHARYPKKLPEYASSFGVTERTIKRLIRRGKETGKLPPLDAPPKMAAWWRENMDHQVPDWLLGFVNKDDRPSGSDPDPSAETGDDRSSNAVGSDSGSRDFSNVRSLDIADNVAALRQTHAINAKLLQNAINAPAEELSEQTIQLRQRNYERSFELLRKAETTLIELQKQRGKLIDKESVRVELAQLFESLRLMRETMTDRILNELERILPRRLQRVFRILREYLRPAIEKVRRPEDEIFRKLDTVDGPDAVEKLLAA